jgi:hypothetical protein
MFQSPESILRRETASAAAAAATAALLAETKATVVLTLVLIDDPDNPESEFQIITERTNPPCDCPPEPAKTCAIHRLRHYIEALGARARELNTDEDLPLPE